MNRKEQILDLSKSLDEDPGMVDDIYLSDDIEVKLILPDGNMQSISETSNEFLLALTSANSNQAQTADLKNAGFTITHVQLPIDGHKDIKYAISSYAVFNNVTTGWVTAN